MLMRVIKNVIIVNCCACVDASYYQIARQMALALCHIYIYKVLSAFVSSSSRGGQARGWMACRLAPNLYL